VGRVGIEPWVKSPLAADLTTGGRAIGGFSSNGRGLYGNGSTGVYGEGSFEGVHGSGPVGVLGQGDDFGVRGFGGDDGVLGFGNVAGVKGESGIGEGVFGQTDSLGGHNGVSGLASNAGGGGVYGQNDGQGSGWPVGQRVAPGCWPTARTARALQVTGRSKFSTAGIAVIASGQKKITVTLAGVTTTDFALATVQGSGAFFVKSASAGTGQFTININKAPLAPATVKVAYFVITP
jgi:hypothetical protein